MSAWPWLWLPDRQHTSSTLLVCLKSMPPSTQLGKPRPCQEPAPVSPAPGPQMPPLDEPDPYKGQARGPVHPSERPNPGSIQTQGSKVHTLSPDPCIPVLKLKPQVRHEQEYFPWMSLTLRLVKGAPQAEVEWTVGPIPFKDGLGREAVVRSAPLCSHDMHSGMLSQMPSH